MRQKKKIKIAIDSPAAAGAGTQAKLISKHFNLFYLDTGKIYRFLGHCKINNRKKFNYSYIKQNIKKLRISDLQKKTLLSNDVGVAASIIAKSKKIRKLVHSFQIKCAYYPPKKYNGSCLDGRDITYKIIPDAELKFFITANVRTRAMRRYKEYKQLNKKISYDEVLKNIKNRDKSDTKRKFGKLKKTKDSTLLNTSNISISACFKKIKQIMDRKIIA